MKLLITGIAGFIGYSVAKRLSGEGHEIVGVDNLNNYYDVSLKKARLADLANHEDIIFTEIDLADRECVAHLFSENDFERVIHLAAQAGVRYSIENPHAYTDSNVTGHLNILEGCRHHYIDHLVYASSSSVYGMNDKVPFATSDNVDHPISLYAATKKANELMCYTYSHLYNVPTTGLRFFTVYGPWGRPDMAVFKFTKAILEGRPIDIYNFGDMLRDFTYIDDIVECVVRILDIIPGRDEAPRNADGFQKRTTVPYSLYNIGNGSPVSLMSFVRAIEEATGKTAECNFMPMQPGDVPRTFADTEELFEATGYRPKVSVPEGVERFVEWYREYYRV